MAATLQELRERHTALAKKTRALVEDNNDKWSEALQEKYEQSLLELDDIKAQVNRVTAMLERMADDAADEAVAQAKERFSHDAEKKSAPMNLTEKWLRKGDKGLTAEDWTEIRNTMSVGTDSQGGFTVQTDIVPAVTEVLKAYGGVRSVASVIQTASGNPINWPTSDGTSEVGELIGENTTATAEDPTFNSVALAVYKFSSKVVAVPFELLQDSSVNIEAFIAARFGTRLGRIENTYFTTGTGTAQPKGVVTAAASGKVGTTGQTVTVIFEDLMDLIHAVDPAYRQHASNNFMMHDSSLKVIRKLKDTSGRPIFLPGFDGLSSAMPDEILGHSVVINQEMAVMAANAKSILFGDFIRYTIRDVMGMTLFRFDDSAYVKLGQIGFLVWMRSGGTLTDSGAPIKYYQNSAT